MEENIRRTTLTQKDYQKKYDKKTKMISVKYVLSDMQDYDRLMNYLEKTGQSTNRFIKMLINGFFEKGYDRCNYPIPKEYEKMEYYKYSEISDEYFEKLKGILGNDNLKYNTILDLYADYTESEIETALYDKACAFEKWVDSLEESINIGEINMESDKDFSKDIEMNICNCMGEILFN